MPLLTQNSKMRKTSQKTDITVVNWTIPAFLSNTGLKTCPMAGVCATGCYARSGTYRFANAVKAHEAKLAFTLQDDFVFKMVCELEHWLGKKSVKQLRVRIHDSGDFYSLQYLNKWIEVMKHFENNKRIAFYAYTKQVQMITDNKSRMPTNFAYIFSYGGKQDHLIDASQHRHSRVFESLEALESAGYVNGTSDDLVGPYHSNHRIGLVFHHAKNWINTAWNKVA